MRSELPCGHDIGHACEHCLVCKKCFQGYRDEVLIARERIDQLIALLSDANKREGSMQKIVTQGHNPIDREERDLAVARVTIFSRKIEKLVRSVDVPSSARAELQKIIDEDSRSRTKPLEQLLAEAKAETGAPAYQIGTALPEEIDSHNEKADPSLR